MSQWQELISDIKIHILSQNGADVISCLIKETDVILQLYSQYVFQFHCKRITMKPKLWYTTSHKDCKQKKNIQITLHTERL